MGDKLLFSVYDPRGYSISLSENRYITHIIGESGHTEVPAQDIKRTLEKPTLIYQSSYAPTADVYFAKASSTFPSFYVKVAVEIDEYEKTGDVITAFLSKEVKGSIKTEGGPKYIDFSNKL